MVKFKELSIPIKIGIIGGWISIILFAGAFLVGFIGELLYPTI